MRVPMKCTSQVELVPPVLGLPVEIQTSHGAASQAVWFEPAESNRDFFSLGEPFMNKNSFSLLVVFAVACGVEQSGENAETTTAALTGKIDVYRDGLVAPWGDWSWATRNIAITSPVAAGTRSISVTFGAWKGLYFSSSPGVSLSGLEDVVVSVHGGSGYNSARIDVVAVAGTTWLPGVDLGTTCTGGKIVAGAWNTCRIRVSKLGASGKVVNGLVFMEGAGKTFSTPMYFDELSIVGSSPADAGSPLPVDAGTPTPVDAGVPLDGGSGGVIEPGNPGTTDTRFTIRADSSIKPISPFIYGVNGTDGIATSRPGLVRAGGNRWTAYNWENNASNAGSDYCFQNDGYLSASSIAGEGVRTRMNAAANVGAAALLTVPLVDYVAADKNGGCDVRNSGPDYLDTRFVKNRAFKGSTLFNTPNAADAFVYQDEFVNWVKNTFPQQTVLYSLDNEPDLWADTHAEVHPAAVGYDELCDRNIEYARAIKSVSPTAQVLGFVSYGWYGYVALQDAPDRAGKGEFIDYYLSRMKTAENQYGRRLVDALDLHWYPEAKGATSGARITGTSTSADVVEARIQAPRSLWDPNYTEVSWIASGTGPIRLIPRIQSKITANYPGTTLAVTEWNYGGGQHVSGAIATADVLGIFGREGVSAANLWTLNADESYTMGALQAFRNFDGVGGRFGNRSILATANDVAGASVYASVDTAAPSKVIVIAINKRSIARSAGITVAHSTRFQSAQVYTITAGSPRPVAAGTIGTAATNAFRYTMPAYSVSVLVLQ